MIDRFLYIAYRFAPEPFAERISLLISERRCARRWKDAEKAHLAAGGMVVSHKWAGGETRTFVGGEPFPQPQSRVGKEPCGECRLPAGETCDICGAVAEMAA